MDPKATLKAMGGCAVALFIGLAVFGGGNSSNPVEPETEVSQATTADCPSGMTREGCERLSAALSRLAGRPVEPVASSAAPTATPSDPCGWQRPSSMTREQCERMNDVAAELWLERERERNPNFKPFSAVR